MFNAPPQDNPQAARADDTPVQEVKPGKLRFEVIEQGISGTLTSRVSPQPGRGPYNHHFAPARWK